MRGLHTDSNEEPIPDDKIVIQRHFRRHKARGLMVATRTRKDNLVTYIVVGKGVMFPTIRYHIVYELVEGSYWKYVETTKIGYM